MHMVAQGVVPSTGLYNSRIRAEESLGVDELILPLGIVTGCERKWIFPETDRSTGLGSLGKIVSQQHRSLESVLGDLHGIDHPGLSSLIDEADFGTGPVIRLSFDRSLRSEW